jgi:hypothetical protein
MRAGCLAMVEEHGHRFVDETDPSVPARIVGDLLVDQTGCQRGPHVDVPLLVDPIEG